MAEDEALAALAIQQYLTFKGFRVTVARDGMEALSLFEADPADAVVTDLRMPRLDGARLIRRLREARPDLPVLVMTGYLGSEDGQEDLTSPAWEPLVVLKKPVSPQDILAALHGFSV
ncbi:MAG TPA: response regulator [Azospirillaceae bacterium]|nr:response regulator [Azospirillaceae bacterium]